MAGIQCALLSISLMKWAVGPPVPPHPPQVDLGSASPASSTSATLYFGMRIGMLQEPIPSGAAANPLSEEQGSPGPLLQLRA